MGPRPRRHPSARSKTTRKGLANDGHGQALTLDSELEAPRNRVRLGQRQCHGPPQLRTLRHPAPDLAGRGEDGLLGKLRDQGVLLGSTHEDREAEDDRPHLYVCESGGLESAHHAPYWDVALPEIRVQAPARHPTREGPGSEPPLA